MKKQKNHIFGNSQKKSSIYLALFFAFFFVNHVILNPYKKDKEKKYLEILLLLYIYINYTRVNINPLFFIAQNCVRKFASTTALTSLLMLYLMSLICYNVEVYRRGKIGVCILRPCPSILVNHST